MRCARFSRRQPPRRRRPPAPARSDHGLCVAYALGLRIGELSLGERFEGVLSWGHIDQGVRFLVEDVRARKVWEENRDQR